RPPRAPPFPYTTLFRSSTPLRYPDSNNPGAIARPSADCPLMLTDRPPSLSVLGNNPQLVHSTNQRLPVRRPSRIPAAIVTQQHRSEEHTSELQSPDHLV